MSREALRGLCIRRSSCAFALHDILIAPKEHFLFISYSLNILVLPSPPFPFPFACSPFGLHRDVRGCYRMPVETRLQKISKIRKRSFLFGRNMMFRDSRLLSNLDFNLHDIRYRVPSKSPYEDYCANINLV